MNLDKLTQAEVDLVRLLVEAEKERARLPDGRATSPSTQLLAKLKRADAVFIGTVN